MGLGPVVVRWRRGGRGKPSQASAAPTDGAADHGDASSEPRSETPPEQGRQKESPYAAAGPNGVNGPRHGLLESFNWAIEGIVWALRRQRNMQIHFAIGILVIIAALAFSVTRVELLLIFAAITFVFVAEMINTAVEHAVDMITQRDHPAAKIAKDVAAGAVFIAALNALAVAYLVFYDRVVDLPYSLLRRLRISEVDLTIVALVLVALLVVVFKAAVGRGTALRGGWPSGHAAVAFGGWTAVTVIATETPYAIPISVVGLIMAVLTAQSRVQAGIHSTIEVVAGAVLGIVVTLAVFLIWSPF